MKRVIATHGLGNQLFQFVFAHALKDYCENVVFENNPIFPKNYQYELLELESQCTHLKFNKNFIISHESVLGRAIYKLKISETISSYTLKLKNSKITREAVSDRFTFDSKKYLTGQESSVLFGFWQHWRFVESQIDTAVCDVKTYLASQTLPKNLSKNSRKRLVIHVRRGDYLHRGLDEVLGVIEPRSYTNLIESLIKDNPDLEVLTLSDDPNLGNNTNYGDLFGQFINPQECNSWQALQVMAEADFMISANSTFSWWGALLASINGGIGFTPHKFHKKINSGDAFFSPRLKLYEVKYI